MGIISPELLSVLLAPIVTAVTSFAKNPKWGHREKTLVLGGVSVVAAVLSLLVTGNVAFDSTFLANLGTNVGVIVAAATAFYNVKFKSTGMNQALEAAGTGSGTPAPTDPPTA